MNMYGVRCELLKAFIKSNFNLFYYRNTLELHVNQIRERLHSLLIITYKVKWQKVRVYIEICRMVFYYRNDDTLEFSFSVNLFYKYRF